MRRSDNRLLRDTALALIAFTLAFPVAARGQERAATPKPQPVLQALEFRNIGPFRGGRVTAVAGVRGEPYTFYQGATGGGIWKTTDAGASWQNVSDKFFKTGSVGAIGISESDPNVIYVGMGEAPIRGNVSNGDGVYKSTDRGKTWANVGLGQTYHIARVRVHPKNPDLVYVAALGHVWGPNPDRGIFRSKDGGKTWEKILFVSDKTGASDLVMDPSNPRVLYAGFWQVRRLPWSLESGGTEGGVYRSTDGGDTWKKLAGGLPEGLLGNVAIAVSPSRPDRVWAMVEAEKGGLYRSDDGGEAWTLVNSENKLRQRAWYYTKVYADPGNEDGVYVLNVEMNKSSDGGNSFSSVDTPHGDNHDLWIDPDVPARMIEGNDGGANVSLNGGRSWSSIMNQPTAQFYRVITDDQFPYRIYGAQQDNTTVVIPSRGTGFGIDETDWHSVGGGESGWIAPKPGNPDVVYAGSYGGEITRRDDKTGQERNVTAWAQLAIGQAPKDLKYRFQWNAPIVVSPHDPNTLYHAAQVLLRSRDEGQTWEEISPDLTRNDKSKQIASGGPITKDNTGVEVFDTIFYVVESPHEAGTIWCGTDDGLVQLTRDGGKSWQNVTPKGLPEFIQINAIDVSPQDKATAYVAATMYKHDDFRPYIYKTNDYGKTWTKIVDGIPDTAFTRVVREDPARRGLLYAGTETGLYISYDDGKKWQPFQLNLPAVPVTDLKLKNGDLIVATQGRAFWVLDDLTPLHEFRPEMLDEQVGVLAPRPAYRFAGGGFFEGSEGAAIGRNPPNGVLVYYWLKDKPADKDIITVEFLDGDKVLRTFTSKKADPKSDEPGEKPLEPKAGLNRVVWDMRVVRPRLLPKAIVWGNAQGPKVSPGMYAVRLTAGGKTITKPFEVKANPNVAATPEELRQQYELLRDLRDRIEETHAAVRTIREARSQMHDVVGRAEKIGKGQGLAERVKAIDEKLASIEKRLVNPDIKSGQDVLNFPPAIDHQFVGLASVVASADAKPTANSTLFFREVDAKLKAIMAELDGVLTKDVAELNQRLKELDVPPIVVIRKSA